MFYAEKDGLVVCGICSVLLLLTGGRTLLGVSD